MEALNEAKRELAFARIGVSNAAKMLRAAEEHYEAAVNRKNAAHNAAAKAAEAFFSEDAL